MRFAAILITFDIGAPEYTNTLFRIISERTVITLGKLACQFYCGIGLSVEDMPQPAMIDIVGAVDPADLDGIGDSFVGDSAERRVALPVPYSSMRSGWRPTRPYVVPTTLLRR